VEINFKMTFTPEQMDTLRSIVQDEATGECQNKEAESVLDFTTKLQSLEKISNWIIQVLLPQAEIKEEQLRVDGVLFRILKRNLPTNLSWAADTVQQQASASTTRKGGTFQHLLSKIYDTLQHDPEMQKDSKEQKKKSVTFGHVAAIKGKLEKDPSARLTKEERTDTKATQVKSTFRPAMKRKAAEEPETEEEEEEEGHAKAVHFLDTQIEDPNSLHSLAGIVRGLAAEVASMAQHATLQQQTQQQQRPQQQQQDCNDFKRGACSRDNCRFSHGNAGGKGGYWPNNSNHSNRGDNPSEEPRPPKACNQMWNESTCTNRNCSWEHGNCAAPGRAGVCNGFQERKHCYFIFSQTGCRFTHSGPTTRSPLGSAIPQ
jgi:hypothetical protein